MNNQPASYNTSTDPTSGPHAALVSPGLLDLRCPACEGHTALVLPFPLAMLAEVIREFRQEHERCQPLSYLE